MTTDQSEFRMSRTEFVALIAMMFAVVAFSIDAMLPALPQIAADLTPDFPERAPLIITTFVFGMGLGTFIAGPLSDAYGRKPVVLAGAFVYIFSSVVAWSAQSLEIMLIARVCQGIGAAGPRIVSAAIIRDLFSGREMARIISLALLIFTLVPAFAPALGALIMMWSSWRGIFVAFMVFSIVSILWMWIRLPETLPKEDRRPLHVPLLWDAVRQIFAHPIVRLAIIVQTLCMAMLFTTLMLVQPIYEHVYARAESFPYWFGIVALLAGTASLLNAVLVVRFGMRKLVTVTLGAQIILSGTFFVLDLDALPEPYGFGAFLIWQTCLFFQAGLTLGNLNALAMEPMGHIAGMAASVVGAVATVLAAVIASPIGMLFDGTPHVLIGAVLILALTGFGLMRQMAKVEQSLPVNQPKPVE